jgi:two-component system LytT family response regulator
MKLTAIVIEDEYKIREMFIDLLKKHCLEIEVVGEAGNITDGYELIVSRKPDVVFLDIEMPKGNGFDLLSKFEKIPFEVIFVSSYEHYAIKALRLSALDFLLKPIMIEDLLDITNRIKQSIALKESAFKYSLLKDNLKRNDDSRQLVLNTKTKIECVSLNQIMYLKAELNYTSIFIANQNRLVVSKTLKEFEEMLCEENNSFIRIHKTYIVNTNYIKTIERGEEFFIRLKDDTRLEVSRRKKIVLMNKLNVV